MNSWEFGISQIRAHPAKFRPLQEIAEILVFFAIWDILQFRRSENWEFPGILGVHENWEYHRFVTIILNSGACPSLQKFRCFPYFRYLLIPVTRELGKSWNSRNLWKLGISQIRHSVNFQRVPAIVEIPVFLAFNNILQIYHCED